MMYDWIGILLDGRREAAAATEHGRKMELGSTPGIVIDSSTECNREGEGVRRKQQRKNRRFRAFPFRLPSSKVPRHDREGLANRVDNIPKR